jgi:hypothetical protein
MITQAYLENIQPQILIELDQAKRNIVLAIAWLTDQQIFDKLCEKSASGIVVELMIYDDEINNNIDFSLLEKVGGKLYKIENQDSKTLDHNKFCVIDFSTVINGSYNWGQIAPQIQETITVSSNAGDLAHQFINEFQRLKEKYIKNQAQTSAFDLAKVLNRLKLIKTLIDLGETEDLPLQIVRLKQFESEPNINEIILNLEARSYGAAIAKTDLFLNQNHQIISYVDTEINGLKLEAKSLEIQLNALSDEKAEMEKLIFNFNVRHSIELGPIIKEILALRKKTASTEQEKQEAEQDEREYTKEYDSQKDIVINELNTNEIAELKQAYRAASKLCHPDAISEEDKEKASKMFIELHDAYKMNDLKKVQQILQDLEKGIAFMNITESISEKIKLMALIERLREKINEIIHEVSNIKESEDYQSISQIEDLETFFKDKKNQLVETLNQLVYEQ